MSSIPWTLSPDRCFAADPARRTVARELYASVKDLPLVCPHGHVPPALLADPEARFGSPAELFIIPDHYVFRMLYSQGTPLEEQLAHPALHHRRRDRHARTPPPAAR
jgi:glucuronate isomerase